jgi:hypothetical protein
MYQIDIKCHMKTILIMLTDMEVNVQSYLNMNVSGFTDRNTSE